LQALGIDGSQVRQLDVGLWIRTQDIHDGVVPEQRPRLIVNFFDANRAPVGQQVIGPWLEDSDWIHKTGRIKVPAKARVAIVGLGLFGATGQLSVDDVEVRPAK
jgi:protein-L-isoaspartate(D-aspartate) O-methyltransferase